MAVYLVAGTFDLLHEGHRNLFIRLFALAKKTFIIAVTSDTYTKQYKEINLAEPENVRLSNIESFCQIHFPDHDIAVILTDGQWSHLYKMYGITHIIHGDDWPKEVYINHMDRNAIETHQITVTLMPHTPGISSTLLRSKKSGASGKTHLS